MDIGNYFKRIWISCRLQLGAPIVILAAVCGTALADVRIDLRYPGVYRITGAELSAAGVSLSDLPPDQLSLYCAGRPVPILVTGGEDGSFDEGDSIEFVGSAPRSELLGDDAVTSRTWFMPENKSNVYFLRWNEKAVPSAGDLSPHQYSIKPAPATDNKIVSPQHFWQWQHWERNYLYTFSTLPPNLTDNFFWTEFRASMTPEGIIRTYLDFPGFDKSVALPVELAVKTLGRTDAGNLKPSHLFSFLYDMKPVGEISFDGIAMHTAHMEIPPEKVKDEPARISFEAPADRKSSVDSILLDSIEARYPSRFDAEQTEIYTFNNDLIKVGSDALNTSVTSEDNLRITNLPAGASIFDPGSGAVWQLAADQRSAVIDNHSGLTTYTAVAPFARMKADRLDVVTTASALPVIDPNLKALVIYHPSLQQTADTYTRYRCERGWNIEAVSVRAVFDQHNDGFISDIALRDYISSVADAATSLTHVVLIGDSYFDYREARSYDDPNQLEVLIPIHWVYRPGVTWSGGYQDDNWYGSFVNEFRPDVAVGRIPVNSDAEGMEYVRKVIAHETLRAGAADKGLLISSVEKSFQSYVSEIGDAYQDKLSTVTYLFPKADTAGKEVTNLQDEINSGVQLMYYVGHGGSLVWRVGPTDFAKQKDLFTPDDVAKLTNKNHYPLIVCASCYTTAFDQPKSIGEALVNQPDGGAIAVIGASWKATVQDSHAFNRHLFKSYFDPSVRTMGEASLLAHREYIPADQERALYNSFTFLGDPCAEIIRQGDGKDGSSVPTTSTVFQVEAGRIVLSEFDSQATTVGAPLVELTINDFPGAFVYRDRVLLGEKPLVSKEFLIPEDATSISLIGRSRIAGEIFPRLRVTLVTADNNRHKVFEGYWQSLSMEQYTWPLPEYARGNRARLEVQMLNSGIVDEERTWYFLSGEMR